MTDAHHFMFSYDDEVSVKLEIPRARVEDTNWNTYKLSYEDESGKHTIDWIPESALTRVQPYPKPGDVWLIDGHAYVAFEVGSLLLKRSDGNHTIYTDQLTREFPNKPGAKLLFRPELPL